MAEETGPATVPDKKVPSKISYWSLLLDQGVVTEEILDYEYSGKGTEDDPFAVTWISSDPRNPMLWSTWRRWVYMMIMAVATMAVAFTSSAYTGGLTEIMMQFEVGTEVATLGVSLFVLYVSCSRPKESSLMLIIGGLVASRWDL